MKTGNIIFNILFIVVLLFSAFTGYIFFSDTKVYAVETGSMEPELSVGDVVFLKETDFFVLRKGDIVTISYFDNSGVFTHRITKIDYENELVYTKGDANSTDDPVPAQADRVIGKLWFSLPLLGYISLRFNRRTVLLLFAGVAIALVLINCVLRATERKKQKTKN